MIFFDIRWILNCVSLSQNFLMKLEGGEYSVLFWFVFLFFLFFLFFYFFMFFVFVNEFLSLSFHRLLGVCFKYMVITSKSYFKKQQQSLHSE